MVSRAFSTPRPIPGKLVPALAGTAVVALALPVFVIAGWPLRAWALGAAFWIGAEALGFLLARLPLGADNLAAAGVVGIGMMFRPIAVMVIAIAVAATDATLGVAAAVVYALAYTLALAVSLAVYFASPAR